MIKNFLPPVDNSSVGENKSGRSYFLKLKQIVHKDVDFTFREEINNDY